MSKSTNKRDEKRGCPLSSVVGRIDHDGWEEFVLKYLKVTEKEFEKFHDKDDELLLDSRLRLVDIWMKKNGANTSRQLKHLVRQFEQVGAKQRQSRSDPDFPSYPSTYGKGCVLIISNSFEGTRTKHRRDAAKADINLMESLWKKKLGCDLFDGKSHMNKKAREMKELLSKIASLNASKKGYDYIVVVISTHGGLKTEQELLQISDSKEEDQLSGQPSNSSYGITADGDEKVNAQDASTEECEEKNISVSSKAVKEFAESPTVAVLFGDDDEPICESEVMEYFCNDNAEGLQDVPKFLIMDYCRGGESSEGVAHKAGDKDSSEYHGSPKRNQDEGEELKSSFLLPKASDVLVAHATHHSYVAYEHRKEGSWLISKINSIFGKYYESHGAVSMLTRVNAKFKKAEGQVTMGQKVTRKRKAMSVFQSSLVKELYFRRHSKHPKN